MQTSAKVKNPLLICKPAKGKHYISKIIISSGTYLRLTEPAPLILATCKMENV